MAGGTITTSGPIRADGGDGGDIALTANMDLTTNGDLTVNSTGTFGDGGSLDVTATHGWFIQAASRPGALRHMG